jgi:hypothetical protein
MLKKNVIMGRTGRNRDGHFKSNLAFVTGKETAF